MFDWFFGGEKRRQKAWQRQQAFLEGLPSAKRKLFELIEEYPDRIIVRMVKEAIVNNNDHELRTWLQNTVIPNATPLFREKLKRIGSTGVWTDASVLEKHGIISKYWRPDELLLGEAIDGSTLFLNFTGEGHLLTVAPTRKGKGQAHIFPNLFYYDGSIVLLDLKGEAYSQTAWYRRYVGEVCKWAPFEEETDAFNPLEFLESWEDAEMLTDLMIIPSGKNDPFWDNSAKALVTGLIVFVVRTYPASMLNMSTVMKLLSPSREEYAWLTSELKASGVDNLIKLANELESNDEKVVSSIFQTARTHLREWNSPQIQRATNFTSEGFQPADLLEKMTEATRDNEDYKAGDNEGEGDQRRIRRGAARTYYLIMPPQRMDSHGGVFRVLLTMLIKEVMKSHDRLEAERRKTNGPKPLFPVLFMMDELPQLGYIPQLEKAMSIAGGMSMRFWLFAQDLEQIEKTYRQASTMMSNCRAQMYFGLQDDATPLMISKRIGKVKGIFGDEDWAVPPEELVWGEELRGLQVIFMDGLPVRSKLLFFYEFEDLKNKCRTLRPMLEKMPDRENMEGRYTSAQEVAPQFARYLKLGDAWIKQRDDKIQGVSKPSQVRKEAPPPANEEIAAPTAAPAAQEKQDFGIDTPPGFDEPGKQS